MMNFLRTFIIASILSSSAYCASHLSVMTFNIENGGTQVDFHQVVRAIKNAKVDIAGLQESWGHTKRLAKELGWKYEDPRQHIVSKFPLYNAKDSKGRYVLIEVSRDHFVAMANIHLPDEPYGPDLIKSGSEKLSVEENERQARLSTALPVITSLEALVKKHVPVFVTGDFNSPSHLDWTQKTVNVMRNHRYPVEWPVTSTFQNKGFRDSYREVNPDPVLDTGYTWPANRPVLKNSFDNFNPTKDDLADRVDFIFTSGPSKVMNSQTIESPTPWPSDHRAVVSQFEVTPKMMSKKLLTPVKHVSGKPSIQASKSIFSMNEPITIRWSNAPGYGYDYIRIVPKNSHQKILESTARYYTFSQSSGEITINAENIHGNWPAWFKSTTSNWPLAPGKYDVQLVEDDGYHVLASTTIQLIVFVM